MTIIGRGAVRHLRGRGGGVDKKIFIVTYFPFPRATLNYEGSGQGTIPPPPLSTKVRIRLSIIDVRIYAIVWDFNRKFLRFLLNIIYRNLHLHTLLPLSDPI